MKTIIAAVVLALALPGCAQYLVRRYAVPSTPEALQCWRECQVVLAGAVCYGSAWDQKYCLTQYERAYHQCLSTCPGAVEQP